MLWPQSSSNILILFNPLERRSWSINSCSTSTPTLTPATGLLFTPECCPVPSYLLTLHKLVTPSTILLRPLFSRLLPLFNK